tara:strand:- start:1368 stop:1775 length:408 start_codon:yes stop_codon:yes gene_type:complete
MSKTDKAEQAKGWKINLAPYKNEVPVFNDQGGLIVRGTEQVTEEVDFDVKETLASLCFNRDLQLEPEGMFKAKEIADKIRSANKTVVLDNEEMEHIRKAYKNLKGLPERFVEFLGRIRDAEVIQLAQVDEPTKEK